METNMSYQVEDITPVTWVDRAGNLLTGVKITFTYGKGFTGTIRLTDNDFRDDNGAGEIKEYISTANRIVQGG